MTDRPTYQDRPISALRSLQSPHHAHNLEPKYLVIQWMLGKRCNYDCSYCAPHQHDLVSPHTSSRVICDFIHRLDRLAGQQGRQLQLTFSGGEPMVHPDILEILKLSREIENKADQLVVTTNGSVPLKTYEQAMQYITNLTISIHLERSSTEVDKVIDTVIALNRNYEKFINVNLMCLPGKMEKWIEIQKKLTDNNVKFVFRRIRPNFDENQNIFKPFENRRDKRYAEMSLELQKHARNDYKDLRRSRLLELYEHYYSEEESKFLKENISDVWWQNCAVWYDNGDYQEANTDDLLTRNETVFTGWTCWTGVDQIYVDFDGTVYRGNCTNDGEIGHIKNSDFSFPNQPTICKKHVCFSNQDVCTRKCRDTSSRHLVDPNWEK